MNIANCPSCLKPGYREFCASCRKTLFNGRRVSPILPFSRPDYNQRKREQGTRLSISGVQSKHSLKLNGTELELTEKGGEYILKPVVAGEFENLGAMPANEHVTMQLARQVFSINTAGCAIVFFRDDLAPAFLTKRFDVLPGGSRLQQEDFAQIAEVSEETHGRNYKYDFSYEKIAVLMKRHVSAYAVEVEKYFTIVLFNYLVNNGDAHLKNFSLYRDPVVSSWLMTPAYDLLNTRLHLPNESAMALNLFEGDFETESHKANGFYSRDDFMEFGARIGIPVQRVERIINGIAGRQKQVEELLNRSFLDERLRTRFFGMTGERAGAIGYSYRKGNTGIRTAELQRGGLPVRKV
jgi:serine/threonine-protein kinase HipA